ncbi:Mfa1 family fimbria major subunit [Paraprevotella clara]|uniref:Mfa1 family fimbria major subunit n=1 Tax=Paraprevotella clara TaxID=454154 RepID=UPI002676602B|nr:Mfa1 family fimbria major subunit [Paraprevotella clara]
MKKKYLFPLAMAGLLLGACSNDDISESPNGGGTTTSPDEGFVAVSINLPMVSGASFRAANDVFDGGMDSEYDVKDAAFLVFEKGDDEGESQAVLLKAYDISDLKPWEPQGGNVTTYANMVQEVPALTEVGDKRYALVVLNKNNRFAINADGSVEFGDTQQKAMTFGDFLTASAMNVADMTGDGFYMANAPISSDAAGTKVTTLVPIEDKIKPTKAEAEKVEAADIYVERGMAKVTLAEPRGEMDVTGESYQGDKVTMTAWALDVTNKTSKLVRDVTGIDTWKDYLVGSATQTRFIGTVADPYRVYWGVDGNYAWSVTGSVKGGQELTDAQLTEVKEKFNVLEDNAGVTFTQFGPEAPQYCLENTFNTDNQAEYATTRVIFKAKYVPRNADEDGTFYQLGTTASIYDKEMLKKKVLASMSKAERLELGIFDETDNAVTVTLPTEAGGNKAGGKYTMAEGGTITYTKYERRKTGTDEWEVVTKKTYDDAAEDGNRKKTENASVDNKYLESIDGRMGTIKYFKAGESYYKALIKHFGDDLTPYAISGEQNIYTEAKHLGRYGVLRNNWYELSVTSVSGPGDAEVPSIEDEWDDPKEAFVKIQVNILSWAKRQQNVDL